EYLTRRRLLFQRLLELLEQPHVLDRDHRLVGEGLQQLDLRGGEGPYLGAPRRQRSNEFLLLAKGNDQKTAHDAGGTHHCEIVLIAHVGNVERTMFAHPAILWLINTDLSATDRGYGTKMSPRNHRVRLSQSQHHIINPANSR